MKIIFKVTIAGLIALATLNGCHHNDPDKDPDLIARVGKQRLTRDDLDKALSHHHRLSNEDSTKLAKAYIKAWIDSRLMSEIAARNIPDMTEINRMVDDYRTDLISWEYRRLMFMKNGDTDFSDDSIAAYYERNKRDFVLERPLVKGVYIKIADNSPSLGRVKKLYKSTRDVDIDKLEKEDVKGIIHYDYFRDRWVDWEQIETRIPYDFGSSPDDFLSQHKQLEVNANGYIHLLEITEYLKSGSTMPLERAEERIKRDLFNLKRRDYETRLRLELYNDGINDGTIIVNTPLD